MESRETGNAERPLEESGNAERPSDESGNVGKTSDDSGKSRLKRTYKLENAETNAETNANAADTENPEKKDRQLAWDDTPDKTGNTKQLAAYGWRQ